MFRGEQSDTLQAWLNQARGTGLSEIGRFCDGLLRDEKAVNAAVMLPWSNGQVEAQTHRLKLVKRQMYGRAKFNLLRRSGSALCRRPRRPARHKAHLDLHGNCGRTQFWQASSFIFSLRRDYGRPPLRNAKIIT